MNDFNSVSITGRLGRDPESREMPGGGIAVSFSIAVAESWKSKDGEKKESTSWIDVACYSHTADFASRVLTKGQWVLVSGKLKQDKWESKEGQKREKVRVVALRMLLISKKEADQADQADQEEVPF